MSEGTDGGSAVIHSAHSDDVQRKRAEHDEADDQKRDDESRDSLA